MTPIDCVRSSKIKSWHVERAAIVYVRQSTPQQVLDHQESTARQYALADRAVGLGWSREVVQIIDDDLGKSGQSIEGRLGFQRLLAQVALDRVGVILGLEMSRLARSCKDWHQLLELCARYRVLLADADGVYDPCEYSDRLLLGLTGMMNEAELHVLKSRLHQGKLNKAKRGELVIAAPMGYLKLASGEVVLDPDEQVRSVVELIFDQFERQGTVHGVLRYLKAQGMQLPLRSHRRSDQGQLQWRLPTRETVRYVLRHPIYAGAYCYGFRPADSRRQRPGHPKSGRSAGVKAEECAVFLKDRFPAYITWERYEENRRRLAANRSRAESTGAIRGGDALLAGLVHCGRCGRRMYVHYRHAIRRASYQCSTLASDYGLPRCQTVAAGAIEAWIAEQLLAALRPAALAASLTAAAAVEAQRAEQIQHWRQRLERARFDADRAGRQFHACEPENRLVARTLERNWNDALRAVQQLENEFEQFQQSQLRRLNAADEAPIRQLSEQVPNLWHATTTTPADRRQIARLLLERVTLTVNPAGDAVAMRAEWIGGAVSEQTLPRVTGSYPRTADWERLVTRLTTLQQQAQTPEAIAAILDREGFRPPRRSGGFTAHIVRGLLDRLGLRPRRPRGKSANGLLQPGEQWLPDLAQRLAISLNTVQSWRKKGWLHARQVGPGPGSPWAVWTNDAELDRLRELHRCPRYWSNQERLMQLRTPTPRIEPKPAPSLTPAKAGIAPRVVRR